MVNDLYIQKLMVYLKYISKYTVILFEIIGVVPTFFLKKSQHPLVHTFLSVALVFSFSIFLILRDNIFFNGDMAINGLIAQDIVNGHWYSWYFYGSNYYGNLGPVLLAFFSFFIGMTPKAMFFLEHLYFAIGVFFLILSIKDKNYLEILTYPFIFFFSTRFYDYTYALGFSLLFLIISVFYFYLKNFYFSQGNNSAILPFFIGIFSGLSLWHNPMYFIILPIYLILVGIKKYFKHEYVNLKHLFLVGFGFIIGLIPFIIATLRSHQYLKGMDAAEVSVLGNMVKSLKLYFFDFSLYFTGITGRVAIEDLFTIKILLGIVVFLIILLFFVYSLIYADKFVVEYLFLGFLFALMFIRGNPFPHTEGTLYAVVRYGIVFYSFCYVLLFSTIKLSKNDTDNIVKNKHTYLQFLSQLCIFILCLFSVIFVVNRYQYAYQGSQTYDAVIQKIIGEEVSVIYCEDFFQACAAIAFIGNAKNIDVQIIRSGSDFTDRNPDDYEKADKAFNKGERVLSLILKNTVSPEDVVLESYNGGSYVLVEGQYKAYSKN